MNILLVCEHPQRVGGWSRYGGDLSAALKNQGHSVHILYPGAALSFMTRPYKPLLLSHTIKRAWKKFQPDILHITVEPYALAVPFLPRKIQEHTVLTIHGNYGRILEIHFGRNLWKTV